MTHATTAHHRIQGSDHGHPALPPTSPRAWRLVAFWVATGLMVLAVLVWSARVPWLGPIVAQHTMQIAGDDFSERLGTAFGLDGRLQIVAPGADSASMQTRHIPAFAARDYTILHYRFDTFPPQQELAFVFRRSDRPDDVTTVTLPRPVAGFNAFDLGRLKAWRGDISEIGFAQYPTAQLIPASFPAGTFALQEATLESASVIGNLGALASDWLAYRPWGLFSVSSVSREAGPNTPRAPAPVAVISLLLFGTALAGMLFLRWRLREAPRNLATVFIIAWLLLDAVELDRLHDRLVVTRAIYAGQPWSEREKRVPSEDLLAVANQVKMALHDASPHTRVLVGADSMYATTRLSYDLLPLNVGILATVLQQAKITQIPAGSVIALYDTASHYNAAKQRLDYAGASIPAHRIGGDDGLDLYRVTSGSNR